MTGKPTAAQRLLPGPLRRPAAVLAACCALVFVGLAVRYHGDDRYRAFDSWFFGLLPTGPGVPYGPLVHAADLVPPVFLLVVVGLTVSNLALRRWRHAVFAVAGPGLTMIVTEVGKVIVGRTRAGTLALPSGHTAGVTSVSIVVALLLIERVRGHLLLAAAACLAGVTLLATAIALVMVVLRFHYPTDTIAGYCVAVATTLGVAFAVDARSGSRVRELALP